VLDLASGEGYGSNLLARQATFVCGVDIDDRAVQHAAEKYRRPNLHFLQGDIARVPIAEERSFDVIVCFEAIEHIQEHDKLLQEVTRLLKPEGLFIVSTPNKEVYRAGPEEPNPFHVKELTFEEFRSLLSGYFSNLRFLGQRVHPGSTLWPIGGADGMLPAKELAVARVDAEFRQITNKQRVAEYFLAVASKGSVETLVGSVLMDHSNELLVEKEKKRAEDVAQREEALTWRAGQVAVLEREKDELLEGIDSARKEAAFARQQLASIYASRSWKFISILRRLLGRPQFPPVA
jgi:SAM-dependent methyltransferase